MMPVKISKRFAATKCEFKTNDTANTFCQPIEMSQFFIKMYRFPKIRTVLI